MIYYSYESNFSNKFKLAKVAQIYKEKGILDIRYRNVLYVLANEPGIKVAKKVFLLILRNLKFDRYGELEKFREDFESLKSQYYCEWFRIYGGEDSLSIAINPSSEDRRYIDIFLSSNPNTVADILKHLKLLSEEEFLWFILSIEKIF